MLADANAPHASAYRWLLFVDPAFRKLIHELQAELGDEFPKAAQALYGEVESPAYKSVLLLMMGAIRAKGSLGLLKMAASGTGDHRVNCAASYALGLLDDDDARRVLMDRYRSLSHDPDDYKPGQLKEVIEAGLAASGEKAIPFLLEQARIQHAAEDVKEGPPGADERYYAAESLLASLRIDHLSPELKKLFLTETDPRIRSSLLVGLARNSSAEVFEFLADVAEQEPRHRLDVLYAVGKIVSDEMLGALPGPLADSLRRIFLQAGPETLKDRTDLQSWIHLGCRLGGAEEMARLRPLFKMDFDKLYGEHGPDVRDTIAYSLGRMKDAGNVLSDFLKELPETLDRSVLIAVALRHPESEMELGPDAIQALLAGIQKQEPGSLKICWMLWPLARSSVEQEAIMSTLAGVFASGKEQLLKWTVIDTAGKLGPPSIPFLESVVKGDSGSVLRMEAARRLVAIGSDGELKGRLASELSDLLMPGKPITLDVFKESGRQRWAYGDLVRDYYGRLGTSEDLKMLDMISDRVTFGEGVDPDDATVYRSYLREQCKQAKDAIQLRIPSR
jgi:HEAT repeat protein